MLTNVRQEKLSTFGNDEHLRGESEAISNSESEAINTNLEDRLDALIHKWEDRV
jgi:hypothetical protein